MILKCGLCYVNCLEKICDYINKSAFAYMAVSGDGFIKGAWNGFLLQVKHLLKFSFANLIAAVFIFLGKVGLTVANCFSLVFIMKSIIPPNEGEEVTSMAGPIFVVGVVTYFTASVFLGLFDTTVLAMMTCLAIDMDLHDNVPQYGPPTFHENVQKVEKRARSIKGFRNTDDGKTNDMA